ncbi:SDR family oxidoreductase [Solirubrum puertoriconensis]|uniref:SDR family oxidoreductase n=1 Tax=Solirubrum puertoriconensis TaxID=1751427 RepID=UPI00098FE627|nr:SDR family oxidoreductase [Solirubrum puertoriconensis]
MNVKLKPLDQQTIVITGASSGIGRATALQAAAKGAKVVLAARSEDELRKVEQEITSKGGQALVVVTDVANRADIRRLADRTIDHFGGFDTWVNDAGISIWGRLDEVSDYDHRRLFETNFWGASNGSLEAIKYLRRHGGALINVGSVASDVAFPLQGMYCASKHAIKGFTDALRMELEEMGAPVSVTLIKPAAINTPFPQHARNYMEKEPKLPPPVYEPEEVAAAILHAATHPERDMYVGGGGKLMSTLNKHVPRAMDRFSETLMVEQQKRKERPRKPQGSLHQPSHGGPIKGDHPGYVMKTSLYTRATMHPWAAGALMAVVGAATVALLGGKRSKGTAATTPGGAHVAPGYTSRPPVPVGQSPALGAVGTTNQTGAGI